MYFQCPLETLLDTAVKLPNNRWVAEKRLQSLKKKFKKDEKFHLDYKIFMNNLFE